MRGDDDDRGSSHLTDVLRRRRATADSDAGRRRRRAAARAAAGSRARAAQLGELVAEAEIVVARSPSRAARPSLLPGERTCARGRSGSRTGRRRRAGGSGRPRVGEPRERRVGAPVEVLGLEDVDPARACGSSSQWRSLRTPMRTGESSRVDEDQRDRDATRERRRRLRLRGHHRARPHRRRADRDRRGEPRRAGPRRARHPRPLRASCWSGRTRGRSSTGGARWCAAPSGRPGR